MAGCRLGTLCRADQKLLVRAMSSKGSESYVRLWEGAGSSRRLGSASRVVGCSKRKHGGVASCRNGVTPGPLGDAMTQQKRSRPQSVQHRRVPASAGLSRQKAPTPPPPRAHSSLGFRESSREGAMPCPRGFDLQGYIRRRGSANDIRIGINGSSSTDEYFERYLEECELATQVQKRLPGSYSTTMVEQLEHSCSREEGEVELKTPSPHVQHPPLCWEDQLKRAQVCREWCIH